MNPFQSLGSYELFVYGLAENRPSILYSTLVLARRGPGFALLTGEIIFAGDFQLVVFERLDWSASNVQILAYGYEAWRAHEKLYWYDSQEHPADPSLATTHPHHKHVPPDIKHHRIPAPGLSFNSPNLLFLIQEIEVLLP